MNEKQWDKDVEKGLEKQRKRTVFDLINEYWDERKKTNEVIIENRRKEEIKRMKEMQKIKGEEKL